MTHLEPGLRADKPLLCLGHLEGVGGGAQAPPRPPSYPGAGADISQSHLQDPRRKAWLCGGGGGVVTRACVGALRDLEEFQMEWQTILVTLPGIYLFYFFFQKALFIFAAQPPLVFSGEVLREKSTELGGRKEFCLDIQMRVCFFRG